MAGGGGASSLRGEVRELVVLASANEHLLTRLEHAPDLAAAEPECLLLVDGLYQLREATSRLSRQHVEWCARLRRPLLALDSAAPALAGIGAELARLEVRLHAEQLLDRRERGPGALVPAPVGLPYRYRWWRDGASCWFGWPGLGDIDLSAAVAAWRGQGDPWDTVDVRDGDGSRGPARAVEELLHPVERRPGPAVPALAAPPGAAMPPA